jgi:hypothetical protein
VKESDAGLRHRPLSRLLAARHRAALGQQALVGWAQAGPEPGLDQYQNQTLIQSATSRVRPGNATETLPEAFFARLCKHKCQSIHGNTVQVIRRRSTAIQSPSSS